MPNCRWPNTDRTLPTRVTNHWWQQSCYGLSRHPCGLMWPLCHFCHPKNNVLLTLLQRNQYSLPKPNNNNQTTGATTPAQLPTTPSSSHSGKLRRGVALAYPNAPFFVVGTWGTPFRIHNAHTLWSRNEGQNKFMRCCQCTWLLTLPLLNMEKEEHLQNLLDNFASLKAMRLGRRENIKWLDGSKHVDETRD